MLPFVWKVVGENNKLPKWKLEYGDYIADVYSAYDDNKWVNECLIADAQLSANYTLRA